MHSHIKVRFEGVCDHSLGPETSSAVESSNGGDVLVLRGDPTTGENGFGWLRVDTIVMTSAFAPRWSQEKEMRCETTNDLEWGAMRLSGAHWP